MASLAKGRKGKTERKPSKVEEKQGIYKLGLGLYSLEIDIKC